MTADAINRLAELIDEAKHHDWQVPAEARDADLLLVTEENRTLAISGEDVAAMLNALVAIQRAICDVRMAATVTAR